MSYFLINQQFNFKIQKITTLSFIKDLSIKYVCEYLCECMEPNKGTLFKKSPELNLCSI